MKMDTAVTARLEQLSSSLARVEAEMQVEDARLKQRRNKVLLAEVELRKRKMIMEEALRELAQLAGALEDEGVNAFEMASKLTAFEGKFSKVVSAGDQPAQISSAVSKWAPSSGHSDGPNNGSNNGSASPSPSSSESGDSDNQADGHASPASHGHAPAHGFSDECKPEEEGEMMCEDTVVTQPEPLCCPMLGEDSADDEEPSTPVDPARELDPTREVLVKVAKEGSTSQLKQTPSWYISNADRAMQSASLQAAMDAHTAPSDAEASAANTPEKQASATAAPAKPQPSASTASRDELKAMLNTMIDESKQRQAQSSGEDAPKAAKPPAQEEPAEAPAASPVPESREDLKKRIGTLIEQAKQSAPSVPVGQALIEAAKSGDAKQVAAMLQQQGTDIFQVDDDQCNALHWASAMGHVEIVEQLCNAGKDTLILTRNSGGKTGLFYAARAGHREVVRMLIKKGSEKLLSMAAYDGTTALDHAKKASKGMCAEMIELAMLIAQKRRERIMNICVGDAKRGATLTRSKSSHSMTKLSTLQEETEDFSGSTSLPKSESARQLLPPPELD